MKESRAPVPTGIQRLLRKAVADPDFRTQLFERRDAVAEAAGIPLTPTERAVLRAASPTQLGAMLEHLPAPASRRRDFFLGTAAAAAALIGGPIAVASQGCARTAGATPEVPPPKPSSTEPEAPQEPAAEPPPEQPQTLPNAGVAPDVPPPQPAPVSRGISPDVPPERDRSRK